MGAPKMKKAERETRIREKAFELAGTGKHASWFEVGSALEKEGYTGAISVLAGEGLKSELDDICRIARSPEETERRENFTDWIKRVFPTAATLAREEIPGLSANDTDPDKLSFWTEGWELTTSREFGSSKLRVDPFGEVLPQELPDFEKVNAQLLAEIVIKAYKQKHSQHNNPPRT
jgi:hypothetical protein